MKLSKFLKSIKPGKYGTPTNGALIAVVLFLGWLNYAVAWENMPVKDTVSFFTFLVAGFTRSALLSLSFGLAALLLQLWFFRRKRAYLDGKEFYLM